MPAPATTTARAGAPHVYLKTHGTRVARLHLSDWIVLVLLAVADGVLNLIEPFHRFVGEDMVSGLRYPLKDNTVPVWAVPVLAVVAPIVIIVGIYFRRRNVYDLHHAILGNSETHACLACLLFSVLIAAVLTDAIKDGVGRPRPDFFWRCFPDGVPVSSDLHPLILLMFRLFLLITATLSAIILLQNYHNVTRAVLCHGDSAVIKEGYKSFPRAFAGLGFLSWYLAGKIKAFDQRGHVAKLCIIALPLLLAAMVAVSRVDDYWHHWQDVFTSGAIGLVVASFCYLQFFPPPSGEQGLWPHSYFQHILSLEGEEIPVQSAIDSSHHQSLALDLSSGPVGIEVRTNSRLDSMEAGARSE
ncbi:hypothetical protein EJB05_41554 [Eragrostis curvula]|uniref:Phosphatidic acid phosphatase type 2/haloperoxidase domain-containing protein n=1 Tax=Eragrostis curvula TaxID=38414 RepID=A0A5J9T9X8_9POAL|nr:hypothetical protein EJB05_41554 [Eragrostis curvula]